MATVEIRKNSYLQFGSLLESNAGTSFWDQIDFPEVVPQDTDVFITIDETNVGRLDLIAFDAYGDPDLWWAIALANRIDLIPSDVYMNRRIRIPDKGFIDSLISKGAQK